VWKARAIEITKASSLGVMAAQSSAADASTTSRRTCSRSSRVEAVARASSGPRCRTSVSAGWLKTRGTKMRPSAAFSATSASSASEGAPRGLFGCRSSGGIGASRAEGKPPGASRAGELGCGEACGVAGASSPLWSLILAVRALGRVLSFESAAVATILSRENGGCGEVDRRKRAGRIRPSQTHRSQIGKIRY
jgi:hypothetical protein